MWINYDSGVRVSKSPPVLSKEICINKVNPDEFFNGIKNLICGKLQMLRVLDM